MRADFAGFVVLAAASLLLASCGQTGTAGTAGPTSTSEPVSRPTPTPTAAPSPAPKFPDFDFGIEQGAFWDYRWSYTERSCAQGRGCSTKEDEGLFRVTLGPPEGGSGSSRLRDSADGKAPGDAIRSQ